MYMITKNIFKLACKQKSYFRITDYFRTLLFDDETKKCLGNINIGISIRCTVKRVQLSIERQTIDWPTDIRSKAHHGYIYVPTFDPNVLWICYFRKFPIHKFLKKCYNIALMAI